MAKFSAGDDSGLKLTPPDGANNLRLESLDKVPLSDEKSGRGAKDPLADLAKEAKRARRQAQATGGLSVTAGGPGGAVFAFGITEAGGVALEQTNVGRLLQVAKQHLARGEFREALNAVTELLRDQAGHPEALYLKALAYCGLGEPLEGLRALAELRAAQEAGAEVKPLLASSANDVRLNLRGALLPTVFQECFEKMTKGEWEAVVTDTENLIKLDPDAWEFHYLRADALAAGGKLEESWQAIKTAFRLASPRQPESLVNLREQVCGRLAQSRMAGALTHYKERRYRQARAAVATLDAELKSARIVTLFDEYLARLDTSPPGSPRTVPPAGPITDTDPLHFFLTRDELPLLRVMRQMERYDLAIPKAREALQYAPHFPYLRYLTALSLYQGLMEQFRTSDPPSLDTAEATTREAREHAVAAQADPEIGDAADFVGVLDRLMVMINEIREEQKKWKVDWAQLEPIIDRYIALMKSAEEGLEGIAHHDRMTQGMNAIVRQVAPLAGKMITKDGVEMLQKITEAATGVLRQLANIRQSIAEGEQVNALWERLATQVDRVKRGLVTAHNAYSLRSELSSIKSDAQTLRRRLTVQEKIKSADDLISMISDIQRQIGG